MGRKDQTITVHFLETTSSNRVQKPLPFLPSWARFLNTVAARYCGRPTLSVHSGALALGGPQTNSSSVQGELLSAKTAPEFNSYRSNLRSRGSHELDPIALTMQARVSPRPFFGILAERTGLIAKKGPPRLCWPSAWCRQVTRYGGLGDAEPEHKKFTMDPWRTPEKVLANHPCNQMADLTGDLRAPASPATT